MRTIGSNRLAVPAADAFASVFLDRVLGILSLLLMALAGLVLARDLARDPAVLACADRDDRWRVPPPPRAIFSRHAAALAAALARRCRRSRRTHTTGVVEGLQRYAPSAAC